MSQTTPTRKKTKKVKSIKIPAKTKDFKKFMKDIPHNAKTKLVESIGTEPHLAEKWLEFTWKEK